MTTPSTPDAPPTSRREQAKNTKAEAASVTVVETKKNAPGRGRRMLKVVVGLVLALLWIRFVLFAGVFPIVERRFDSPEIAPAEEEVESLGSIDAWHTGR